MLFTTAIIRFANSECLRIMVGKYFPNPLDPFSNPWKHWLHCDQVYNDLREFNATNESILYTILYKYNDIYI